MATNGREICCIPDCNDEVRYYQLRVCAACYSGLARWRGRSVAEKRRRLEINHRLVSRMGFVMENPKHHPRTQAQVSKEAARRRRTEA